MKTVLVSLCSKYIHSSLAVWYLAAAAKEAGHEVSVFESTVNAPIEDAAAAIAAQSPDVVAISCYIWNITTVKALCRMVRHRLPGCVIILGGPEVSYNTGEVFGAIAEADYIICGEGETPFPLLLSALERGGDAAAIPGVATRGRTAAPYVGRGDPPDPYSAEYFATLGGRIAYLETSRGCPFSCAYCLSSNGSVRFFDMARVRRDIVRLASSGAQTIKLVDRTFNANGRRAKEIIAFIISRYGAEIPQGVRFHFEIAGDLLDAEALELLKSAPPGLFQLEIGLQSFNENTLASVSRVTDTAALRRNVEALISFGNMHIHLDLIAGLPGENLHSFADSFDTAFALRPHMLQLGFLKLLHGAPMREEASRFPCEYSDSPPYEVISTPDISEQELDSLRRTEDALDRVYNSGRFRRTVLYLLDTLRVSPFDLFTAIGALDIPAGISLDDYTARLLTHFAADERIDPLRLRDAMVCDRLSTNASGKLPACLRHPDPRLARLTREKGLRKGCAILRSRGVFVRADYDDRDPVSGEYRLIMEEIT